MLCQGMKVVSLACRSEGAHCKQDTPSRGKACRIGGIMRKHILLVEEEHLGRNHRHKGIPRMLPAAA